MRPGWRALGVGAAACTLGVALVAAQAATLRIGPATGLSLAAALSEARDGDVVEIPPGTYRGEVGVITQQRLTLRGVGGAGARPQLQADGRSAEGKAILVVRGGDVRIENIAFSGARVPDRNGAGIRFERGHLQVVHCEFTDNENGILTAGFADAELRIEDSDFRAAPPATPLPHLLYVGTIGRLTVVNSRFSGGRDGHLLKSRALISDIRDSRFVDGPEGQAAYELEFPNGGQVTVTGSVVGQSLGTSNPVMVSYGTEGYAGGPHALVFTGNTLINEAQRPSTFLRVRSVNGNSPPVSLQVENNRLLGPGDPGPADAAHGNTRRPLPGASGSRP